MSNDRGNEVSTEPVVKLRHWLRDGEDVIYGNAYGHPRFPDGERVFTSAVQYQFRWKDELYARTQGALYELLATDGQPWFAARQSAPYRHPSRFLKPVVDRGE